MFHLLKCVNVIYRKINVYPSLNHEQKVICEDCSGIMI